MLFGCASNVGPRHCHDNSCYPHSPEMITLGKVPITPGSSSFTKWPSFRWSLRPTALFKEFSLIASNSNVLVTNISTLEISHMKFSLVKARQGLHFNSPWDQHNAKPWVQLITFPHGARRTAHPQQPPGPHRGARHHLRLGSRLRESLGSAVLQATDLHPGCRALGRFSRSEEISPLEDAGECWRFLLRVSTVAIIEMFLRESLQQTGLCF